MQEIGIAGWLFHRSILHEKTMTLLDLPATCASLDVKTIELVSSFFPSQGTAYLNQLRAAIEAAGVGVRNIAVDMGNIANPDAAARRTDIEGLKQWFYVARAIGAKAIRINSGSASPEDPDAIDRISEGYGELADAAGLAGVYLLIENHGGASADPQNIKTFLDRVNSPWFKTCPDTSNFTNETWGKGMQIMAPYAYSCHIKAYSYSADGVQRWGDSGDQQCYDLRRSLQILKGAGYTGPLYIEGGASATETDSGRDGIAYVRELITML